MRGIAEHHHGTLILTFDRDLDHPIEKVWASLTQPEHLTKWIAGDEAVMELRKGGRVWFAGHGGIESTVVDVDPPRVISYGWRTSEWDGGVIRFELSERNGGTHLHFKHAMNEPDPEEQKRLMQKMGFGPEMYDPVPRNLAGWHSIIDELANEISGGAVAQGTPRQNADRDAWKHLHRMYVQMYEQV